MNPHSVPILRYTTLNISNSTLNSTLNSTSLEDFAMHLQILHEKGYRTISISELQVYLIKKEEITFPAVIITFDNPTEELYHYGLPLMEQYGFKATLYLEANSIGLLGMLTAAQLRDLSRKGFELGCLGSNLSESCKLSTTQLFISLKSAVHELQEHTEVTPHHFAFPMAVYSEAYAQNLIPFIVEFFQTAVTQNAGFTKEPYAFARQSVHHITPSQFLHLLTPPRLSACLIVKNEEKFLSDCLESIRSLADEIIVVDTGSLDSTQKIALTFTDIVYSYSWTNDFAAARNYSLLHATGDWIFVIDADEILDSADHSAIRDAMLNSKYDAYQITTRNYTTSSSRSYFYPCEANTSFSQGFIGWYPSLKVRLFRNHQDFHFEGKVHEIIKRSKERSKEVSHSSNTLSSYTLSSDTHNNIEDLQNIGYLSVPIHHYGEKRGRSDKPQNYLQLVLAKVNDEPTNAKAYFELAIQYKELQDFTAAETALRKAITLDSQPIEQEVELALLIQKQQRYDQSITAYTHVLERLNNDKSKPKLLSEAYFGLAFSQYKLGDIESAIHNFEHALRINPSHIEACVNLGAMYEKQNKYGSAIAYLKKALTLAPTHARAHYNLGLVYEKQGNLGLALDNYQHAISLHYPRSSELQQKVIKIKELFPSFK